MRIIAPKCFPMLQKTFDIRGAKQTAGIKFIETGQTYIACWNKDTATAQINAFEFFQFDENDFSTYEDLFSEVSKLSAVLQQTSSKTFFVWNNAEAACVPSVYYSDIIAADFVNLLYGEMLQPYLHTQSVNNITVVSRLKPEMQQAAEKIFPGAQFGHAWIYALKNSGNSTNEKYVVLNFYPGTFTLVAFSGNNLQLMQSRNYQTPEDVLYYLLNFFKQYDWNNEEAKVFAAGLIDPHSKLYETLYQYIAGFTTAEAATGLLQADEFKNYPQHFFLPFANYAA